jgi:hypothetical protein
MGFITSFSIKKTFKGISITIMIINKCMVMKDFEWYPQINVDEDVKELEMTKKFKSYNVIRERVELYKDFTLNLLYHIHNTYLGKDYLRTKYDVRGHFTWSYGKVLEEFEEEGISFFKNDELYEYFYGYYKDQFYNKKNIESLSHYEKFWENIFDISETKKRNIFEVLLELYDIFDKTINQKNEEMILI